MADQVSKIIIFGAEAVIISGFLSISAVKNTGAGFGILKGYSFIIIAATLLFLLAVAFSYRQLRQSRQLVFSAALITGGALGNLFDRIFLGFVRDFISFSFWPSFNIADIAITTGGIIAAFYFLRNR